MTVERFIGCVPKKHRGMKSLRVKKLFSVDIFNVDFSEAVAELWGIWDGLLLFQKQGYDEVIIQSDNLENVIIISASKPDALKSSLIRRIYQILAFEEKWSLSKRV
ncbi:hypothetical protein J1N35_018358 [Gossypium stocksii]|uniref:RNase H type-1 domain-containing protein n=1 Tax=Gossypium stocksii TaxID=47602 RepID=A0A9D3VNV0_9ROSI|nr:hypothetical protein J1N35_018358 [Gossypium stocksii]